MHGRGDRQCSWTASGKKCSWASKIVPWSSPGVESEGQYIHEQFWLIASGDTGLVGTAAYISPELLKPAAVKYSQKVDTYSLGLIFFEMCHPPPSTAMERHKILSEVRQKELTFPESFDEEKRKKEVRGQSTGRCFAASLLSLHSQQADVIRWLLNHNPHDRPSTKRLLQDPELLPPKMEDEELQEVWNVIPQ